MASFVGFQNPEVPSEVFRTFFLFIFIILSVFIKIDDAINLLFPYKRVLFYYVIFLMLISTPALRQQFYLQTILYYI
jgi:hypothetical protein